MANRNRSAGLNFERQIARELKDMGYDAVTSRYESKRLDDAGVDLVTNFPLAPQMKVSQNTPDPHKLLTETEAEVIFFKKVKKANKKFMPQGEYIMLTKENFYNLIKQTDGHRKIVQLRTDDEGIQSREG